MNRDVTGDLLRRALSPPSNPNTTELIGRAIFWIALVLLSWSVVLAPIERSQMAPNFVHLIMSRVNLVFHEAGHVIFSPLGQFMGTLGGSLLQVLLPSICMAAFLTRYLNPFGASACFWWMGQSMCELAPYIHDARAQRMILLGGRDGSRRTRLSRLEQHSVAAWSSQVGSHPRTPGPSFRLGFHRDCLDLGSLPTPRSVLTRQTPCRLNFVSRSIECVLSGRTNEDPLGRWDLRAF